MHQPQLITTGVPLGEADKVLIMLHGRGGSAEDIATLADHLQVADYTILAPQATNHSWYPQSFLAPVHQNEPWLSSALNWLNDIEQSVAAKGIPSNRIYFAGFSQGACLTLEYTTRNAKQYGGVVAFTGGLIGDALDQSRYVGDFAQTPILIGTSDPDPHVPVQRVNESASIILQLNGNLTKKIYPGMGHTIHQDELALANQLIFK